MVQMTIYQYIYRSGSILSTSKRITRFNLNQVTFCLYNVWLDETSIWIWIGLGQLDLNCFKSIDVWSNTNVLQRLATLKKKVQIRIKFKSNHLILSVTSICILNFRLVLPYWHTYLYFISFLHKLRKFFTNLYNTLLKYESSRSDEQKD